MENKDPYFEIAKLIAGELTGAIGEEDQKKLEAWKLGSEENLRIYNQIRDKTWYPDHTGKLARYPVDEGWKKISPRIATSPPRRVIFLNLLKYAAVATIIFSVFFFVAKNRREVPPPVASAEQPELIVPGVQKAKLVLEDGTIVPLSADSTFEIREKDGTLITKKSGTIDYVKKESALKEEIFNTVITTRGEEFTLLLSDGTTVILNAESKISFPVNFVKEERIIEISGEAYLAVAHDARSPFIVKTKGSITRVLGTSFNVRAYEDEKAEVVTLVEGSLRVNSLQNTQSPVVLKPGEQASLPGNGLPVEVEKVDADYYTSWKEGKFIFRNERLEDIVKTLQRWYHFEVEFENKEARDIRFGASLDRYSEVNPIFKIMAGTRMVDIIQEKNKFMITKPVEKE